MIFVIGGAYSGKADYVREKFNIEKITPYNARRDSLKNARAIRDIHLYIRSAMEHGADAYDEINRLLSDNPDAVLISNEIGCGVVPLDKFDREYRETVGRIHCMLTEKAERAIRVVCGIGAVLK